MAATATGGDDTLIGGEGDDNLWGNSGADVFRFDENSDDDTIHDFEQGVDLVEFSQSGLDFNDLTITDNGDHRLIEIGSDSIAIFGLDAGVALTASDFIFQ